MNSSTPGSRLPTAYRPEVEIVSQHLAFLADTLDWRAVQQAARPWVQAARDNPPPFWAMETLLKEYPLSSSEGLALMRLAEALLRVPDAQTAIALTADQLGRADFDAMDNSSAIGRLCNIAIAQSKHLLPDQSTTNPLSKLAAKTIVAASLRAVQLLGKQFVLGQTIEEAIKHANQQASKQARLTFSFDMLGEGARTMAQAQHYFANYQAAIAAIHANRATRMGQQHHQGPRYSDGISIKLSALHPRYEWTQHRRVMTELVPTVWTLVAQAAQADMNLTIDAEEVDRLELSLDLFEAIAQKIADNYPNWGGFGLAIQAYQTRSVQLVEAVAAIARRAGIQLMCRLVKGAYWDAEVKRCQELGLAHYPVFTHKHHTDISYLACAKALLQAHDCIYAQFATHNAGTIAAIEQLAQRFGCKFELQRLHGMGEGIYREVLRDPQIAVRVYAPVGNHKDLLAYLVRRLLENGANSSFVHQLADDSVSIESLLSSPLYLSSEASLVNPQWLFGQQRKNSLGLDLADQCHREPLLNALKRLQLPKVAEFDPAHASAAMARALAASKSWGRLSVEHRAEILRHAADQLEQRYPEFCSLLVKEAFKTWNDALSEVREAVDFLRYYAQQAELIMTVVELPSPTGETNRLMLKPRGVWVAISPWNFPLAIFLGQIAAALVTGNAVLAKPAEQTPAVAQAAVQVMYAAGVPKDVLQLAHGDGGTVGAALVALPEVAGVVFTGSTEVARIINRTLAAKEGPIVPLIAETGGINAMVVDSTALPEQVCDAVISSAFRSAGQRCSALRLLCVHEAIADDLIKLIREAAQQLRLGESSELDTDIGPVIDQEAYTRIADYVAQNGQPITGVKPNWVPPTILEIEKISSATREIFGPVLHIVRWQGDPSAVIEQINQLGYGLTLGIQSRIDSRAQSLAERASVGNVYVNRNIIGAVVGTQPFGGEGLSGTGPKAGGPHYLLRFCVEQTITINTAAAGGNATLLAGQQTDL